MPKTRLKVYLAGGTIFLMGFIFGYLIGYLDKNQAYKLGLEQGRKEIEEKYQKKIAEVFPAPLEPEEIFSFSGTISDIQERTLIVEETVYPANPFLGDPETRQWLVRLTETTKFVELTEKTSEELIEEEKLLGETPFLLKEEEVGFSELKTGQTVTVKSEENIKGRSEIEAKEILLVSATY